MKSAGNRFPPKYKLYSIGRTEDRQLTCPSTRQTPPSSKCRFLELALAPSSVTVLQSAEYRLHWIRSALSRDYRWFAERWIAELTFRRKLMLYWTLVFLVIALIAGVLGFTGVAVAAAGIAKLVFFIFIVLFLISLVSHLGRRGSV